MRMYVRGIIQQIMVLAEDTMTVPIINSKRHYKCLKKPRMKKKILIVSNYIINCRHTFNLYIIYRHTVNVGVCDHNI